MRYLFKNGGGGGILITYRRRIDWYVKIGAEIAVSQNKVLTCAMDVHIV